MIERWTFGINNDELVELVISGKKTATTSLYSGYSGNLPKIGDKSIITYSNGEDACLIENTNVIVTEFKNITEELSYLEGEGVRSLKYYRKVHEDYFKTKDKNFNDNTLVVFEIFRVIKNYNKN